MQNRTASVMSALGVLIPLHAGLAATTTLATSDQLAAETRALRAEQTPGVRDVVEHVRSTLLADPAAATPEGRAGLDHALTLWLNSLALRESESDQRRPAVIWEVDDTPHSWHGHTIGGAGVAGDNPDNIYRGTFIDGAGRYEITGHVPANGPTQFSIEAVFGEPGRIVLTTLGKGHVDMGNQVGMLRDVDVVLDRNRNFTITLDPDPAGGRPNHIRTKPGPITVVLRNSLSDWRQVPTGFAIRRLDGSPGAPLTDEAVAQRIEADLPGWVAGWARFKEGWLGRPAVNTLAGPIRRDGGWGFAAGGRFDLRDDEALVITTTTGGARYTGFQVLDRWFMAADARHAFTSLNNSQVTPNPDGSVTYVVAPRDPGVANWLDTSGLHQGYVNIRWQQTSPQADAAGLLKSVVVVKLHDLAKALPAGAMAVSAFDRATRLQARAIDYEARLRD